MDVILMAVRWYLSYPLSSRQMVRLLAEWGIDVSHCTVLTWTQRSTHDRSPAVVETLHILAGRLRKA